jgi:hypothetical protein
MLGFLSRISPVAVLILGAAPAAVGGWLARGVVVDRIEIPRVVTQQVELCTSRTEATAAAARAEEQLRRFRAGELATEQFIRESQSAEDDRQARIDVLEMEIEHYAQRLAGRGEGERAACGLTADDLDFIGVQRLGAADGSGS